MGARRMSETGDGPEIFYRSVRHECTAAERDFRANNTPALPEGATPSLTNWIAIDENLDPHPFRVCHYKTLGMDHYATEYGFITFRSGGCEPTLIVTPKGRRPIHVAYPVGEEPNMQEMLSLLVFWHAQPLFLAVPDTSCDTTKIEQQPLF